MTHHFQERYAEAFPRLTPTERRVGEYMLRNPDKVIDASALQIAAMTESSDATVIRTVQSLQYSGLREVKREFLQDVLRRRNMSTSLDHSIDRALATERPIFGALEDSISVLETFKLEIDEASLNRAIHILGEARKVFTYGLGPGNSIALFFSLYLCRTGLEAQTMTQTGYRLADELIQVQPDDCIVLFAPYHQMLELEVIADHANTIGTRVILVTEALGASLSDHVTVVIRTPATISNLSSEMLIPLVLSSAITTQLAARNRETAISRSNLFNEIIGRFTGSTDLPSPPFLPDGTQLS